MNDDTDSTLDAATDLVAEIDLDTIASGFDAIEASLRRLDDGTYFESVAPNHNTAPTDRTDD